MTPDAPRTDAAEGARRIENRMEDCGLGHHVGWWSVNHIGERHLLIEVRPATLLISCCEGERAERRITFITNREKAVEIVRAVAQALGVVPPDDQAPIAAEVIAAARAWAVPGIEGFADRSARLVRAVDAHEAAIGGTRE